MKLIILNIHIFLIFFLSSLALTQIHAQVSFNETLGVVIGEFLKTPSLFKEEDFYQVWEIIIGHFDPRIEEMQNRITIIAEVDPKYAESLQLKLDEIKEGYYIKRYFK